jgi:type II secretion system protein D
MNDILLQYEELTGRKVVRDINVESVSFTIQTTGELPKSKAVEFIEKSLLLNGYAFIPTGDPDIFKFLNIAALKPGAEGPDLFSDLDKLPTDERVVTYIQPLQFLEAEDLKKSLTELVPPHAYSVITSLPNSRGVIITDNTATIRYYIRLIEHLDVEPSRTAQKSIQLMRSSAEKVAEQLMEILDLESKKSSSGGGSSSGSGGRNFANTAPPTQPGQPPGAPAIPAQNGAAAAQGGGAPAIGGAPQAAAIPPKIIPITRTNKLLVIARPIDLTYIEALIEELDGASEIRNYVSRPMKFMTAIAALPVIEHAITRGMDDEGSGGANGSSGGNTPSGGNNSTTSSGGNQTGNFGRNGGSFGNSGGGLGGSGGFGGGMGGGMGGGGSLGGGGGLSALGGDSMEPKSVVIGKTLIIADPVRNEIFASGPPDQLQALNDVLDQLDQRPRSVVINAVIGELTLVDNKSFGTDYLLRPQQFGGGKNFGTVAGSSRNDIVGSILDPSNISKVSDFGTGSGLNFFGTLNDQVNVALTALATSNNFRILSRPTITTLNNKPASIETGVRVPIPVSTQSSFNGGAIDPNQGGVNSGLISNIQYQDVSLRLDVSPLIMSDDEIMLQVKQVNASIAGTTVISGNPIPNISQQGLDTTITLRSGSTVLLGGLISESVDRQRNGIPILKDIPIIKYLASSMKNEKQTRELLVFINPRVITGNGDDPPSPTDAAGNSPLGDDMKKFLSTERDDPDTARTEIKRSRAATFFRRFFK